MAPEVASRQLRERRLAVHRAAARDALLEQGPGVLFAATRPADQDAVELRVHEQMGKPLADRRDAHRGEHSAKLRTSEGAPPAERPLKGGVGTGDQPRLDLELAATPGEGRAQPRRGQLEQPADVLGNHEVPRGAHDVGAQDSAVVVETIDVGLGREAAALSESPLGRRVVLGLHSAQSPHGLDRRRERLPDEPLGAQSPGSDVRHGDVGEVRACVSETIAECITPPAATA